MMSTVRLHLLILWFCCIAGLLHAGERPVNVFAAASLQNAITDLVQNYAAKTGREVQISVAGTSMLARQIEYGAPADIFISANESWVDHLLNRGLLNSNSVTVIAENSLVLIARDGADGGVSILDNKWNPNVTLATAMIGAVPAGIYAQQTLEHFGLWHRLQNQVIQTDNVRSALRLVELGEADFGLVYYSDAAASDGVRVVEQLPAKSHSPIQYHVALISNDVSAEVRELYDVLVSEEFANILQANSFVIPK